MKISHLVFRIPVRMHSGRLRRWDPVGSWGFVYCALLKADVFVDGEENDVTDFEEDDLVLFNLITDEDQLPAACQMRKASPQTVAEASDEIDNKRKREASDEMDTKTTTDKTTWV